MLHELRLQVTVLPWAKLALLNSGRSSGCSLSIRHAVMPLQAKRGKSKESDAPGDTAGVWIGTNRGQRCEFKVCAFTTMLASGNVFFPRTTTVVQ